MSLFSAARDLKTGDLLFPQWYLDGRVAILAVDKIRDVVRRQRPFQNVGHTSLQSRHVVWCSDFGRWVRLYAAKEKLSGFIVCERRHIWIS